MAKNLVNGNNIVIHEDGNDISLDLSSDYNDNLIRIIDNEIINKNVYSTEEKMIGTWIDGKPLYRKTFTGKLSNTSTVNIDITSLNCSFCYLKQGALVSDGGPIYTLPYGYDLVDIKTSAEIDLTGSTKKIVLNNGGNSSVYSRGTYYVTIEYTKTTN